MRDVFISPPPAIQRFSAVPPEGMVSDKEIISMQQTEIRFLQGELERLRTTANTIANTAAALSYLAQRSDSEWVTIPKDVHFRMRNVKLSVRQTDEGTQVRWVTRAPDHVLNGG